MILTNTLRPVLVLLRNLLHTLHRRPQNQHRPFPPPHRRQSHSHLDHPLDHDSQRPVRRSLLSTRYLSMSTYLFLVGSQSEPSRQMYQSRCHHDFDLCRFGVELCCRLDIWTVTVLYREEAADEEADQSFGGFHSWFCRFVSFSASTLPISWIEGEQN